MTHIDHEFDPRTLPELLKSWRPEWTRNEKAAALRVPRETYDSWCKGKRTPNEKMLRRLMTLIDVAEPAGAKQ
jgi:hypothetical protein